MIWNTILEAAEWLIYALLLYAYAGMVANFIFTLYYNRKYDYTVRVMKTSAGKEEETTYG